MVAHPTGQQLTRTVQPEPELVVEMAEVLVLTPEVEPVLQQLQQLEVRRQSSQVLTPDPNETFESVLQPA